MKTKGNSKPVYLNNVPFESIAAAAEHISAVAQKEIEPWQLHRAIKKGKPVEGFAIKMIAEPKHPKDLQMEIALQAQEAHAIPDPGIVPAGAPARAPLLRWPLGEAPLDRGLCRGER